MILEGIEHQKASHHYHHKGRGKYSTMKSKILPGYVWENEWFFPEIEKNVFPAFGWPLTIMFRECFLKSVENDDQIVNLQNMLDLSDELIECQKEPFDCTSSLERISIFNNFWIEIVHVLYESWKEHWDKEKLWWF